MLRQLGLTLLGPSAEFCLLNPEFFPLPWNVGRSARSVAHLPAATGRVGRLPPRGCEPVHPYSYHGGSSIMAVAWRLARPRPPGKRATSMSQTPAPTNPAPDAPPPAGPEAEARDPSLEEGAQIEAFTLRHLIARGGHGLVYAAYDTVLQRRVAIKTLPPEVADDPQRQERLLAEARLIARLRHPHIVTVHTGFRHAGHVYVVLEEINGPTLRERLHGQGRLSLPEALRLADDLAQGLGQVHERGFIHCDIKPENIVLDERTGNARLLDFGIASPASPRGRDYAVVGGERPIEGTRPYVAPERLSGTHPDVRVDIYALGVVLYEALVGGLPFSGGNPQASTLNTPAPLDAPLPAPPGVAVPRGVAQLIRRCTAWDPDARYAGMEALRADLRPLLTRHARPEQVAHARARALRLPAAPPPSAPPSAPPPRPRRPAQRRRLPALVVALLPALILLIAAGLVLPGRVLPAAFVQSPTTSPATATQPPAPTAIPTVEMPALVDLSEEDARSAAQTLGLTIDRQLVTSVDAPRPRGTVLAQQPDAGQFVRLDQRIALTVSTGRYAVPDVAKLSADEAEKRLDEAGFRLVKRGEQKTDTVAAGTVVQQRPAAKTTAEVGSEVEVDVAVAPDVRVPNLRGQTREQARRTLESAGLKLGKVQENRSFGFGDESVTQQTPRAASQVRPGTTVDITVNVPGFNLFG